MQEYAENRSITSVVPVDNPLTTDEPELLEMSPEQAEETQLCASFHIIINFTSGCRIPWLCEFTKRNGGRV